MDSTAYTREQWALTNRVMDLVDDARQAPGGWSDSDSDRVTALVEATYQSQGIAVDRGIIRKAMAVALKRVPAPTAGFSKTQPSAAEEARQLTAACERHALFNNRDLADLLRRHLDGLERQRARIERPLRWLNRAGWVGAVGAIILALWAAVASLPVLFAAGVGLLTLSILLGFNNPSSVVERIAKDLRDGEEALAALERGSYEDKRLTSITHTVLPYLRFFSLKPLAKDSWMWAVTARAAEEDATLFRTWGRWLASDRPIRECDAWLLKNAAAALTVARAAQAREVEDVEAQRSVRTHLLQQHGAPARPEGS